MRLILTPRQKNTLVFIVEFVDRNGYPPTVREIMANFGLKSTNALRMPLWRLFARGLLKEPRRYRSRGWSPTAEGIALARASRPIVLGPTRCPRCQAETFREHPPRLCQLLLSLEEMLPPRQSGGDLDAGAKHP